MIVKVACLALVVHLVGVLAGPQFVKDPKEFDNEVIVDQDEQQSKNDQSYARIGPMVTFGPRRTPSLPFEPEEEPVIDSKPRRTRVSSEVREETFAPFEPKVTPVIRAESGKVFIGPLLPLEDLNDPYDTNEDIVRPFKFRVTPAYRSESRQALIGPMMPSDVQHEQIEAAPALSEVRKDSVAMPVTEDAPTKLNLASVGHVQPRVGPSGPPKTRDISKVQPRTARQAFVCHGSLENFEEPSGQEASLPREPRSLRTSNIVIGHIFRTRRSGHHQSPKEEEELPDRKSNGHLRRSGRGGLRKRRSRHKVDRREGSLNRHRRGHRLASERHRSHGHLRTSVHRSRNHGPQLKSHAHIKVPDTSEVILQRKRRDVLKNTRRKEQVGKRREKGNLTSKRRNEGHLKKKRRQNGNLISKRRENGNLTSKRRNEGHLKKKRRQKGNLIRKRRGKGNLRKKRRGKGNLRKKRRGKGNLTSERRQNGNLTKKRRGMFKLRKKRRGKGNLRNKRRGKGNLRKKRRGKGNLTSERRQKGNLRNKRRAMGNRRNNRRQNGNLRNKRHKNHKFKMTKPYGKAPVYKTPNKRDPEGKKHHHKIKVKRRH